MKIKPKIILIVLAVVVVVGSAWAFLQNNKQGDNDKVSGTGPNAVVENGLINKESTEYKRFSQFKGDEFDRIYLANMIEHHKGAVDMVRSLQVDAVQDELKRMADAIITAQSQEINQMESLQKKWGYPASTGEMMMDHSAMGMTGEMATMSACLDGLEGKSLEETFLALMIKHHQSAIDMSGSAETNAKHDEVKQLAQSIIQAQSREINQMKQWQKAWDYDPWGTAMECVGH